MNPESQANPNDKPSASPLIGNCLSCQGLVKVPIQASALDEARCPHCGETFRLAQVLEQVVPELELVDPTVSTNESVPEELGNGDEPFVVPNQLAKGATRRRRSRKPDKEPQAIEASESETSVDPAASISVNTDSGRENNPSNRSSNRSRSKGRRGRKPGRSRGNKKPPSSALFEILKIAMGAVLAIPIAYLLVMWGFKQDPLNVAPTIGQKLPALVPAKFRPDAPDDGPAKKPDANTTDPDTNSQQPKVEPAIKQDDRDGSSGKLAVPKIDPDKLGRNQ